MATEHPKPEAGSPIREAPFYIPATNAPARPRRSFKHNDTFAVFDSHGDIGASAGGEDGLFDSDTRHLSHLELLVAGSQPLLLHSAVSDDNLNYLVDLTNPDIYAGGRIALLKDTIHISRTIYLCEGSLRERICLVNHGADLVTFSLALTFASDFADIFEVRGIKRLHRGKAWSEVVDKGCVRLSYRGLDDRDRHTILLFQPEPTQLKESIASYVVRLAPQQRQVLFVSASSRDLGSKPAPTFFRGFITLKREQKETTSSAASVETSDSVLNEILSRSRADLRMLMTATPDGLFPYAGIPWYSTTFGRDAIITALEMLWLDAGIAEGVLKRLARLQATAVDAVSDASPGKIVHETRAGEMAVLGEVPFRQYYGSVDATPLFVMLAGEYAKRTGDWALIGELWPAIEAAIGWFDGEGDADGDGFVEYARGAVSGLANQGWKDSHDSVFHADGRIASGAIALVEVQGYVYAARRAAADCARALGHSDRAIVLDKKADELRAAFEKHFWCEDLGFYAMALDGSKSPCRVRSSNAGHALWTRIVSPERATAVAKQLVDGAFFSGWGVRTLAHGEARYNPMSYHNGSIWPHDNALIARGLENFGEKRGVADIFEALMKATTYLDLRRIPELYCGFRRRPRRGPTLYPAACSPQAWAAAAPFSLIQSMLGLEFLPGRGEIRLNDPIVPPIAGALVLKNIRMGSKGIDFVVRRSSRGTAVEVLGSDGDLRVTLGVSGK